MQLGRIVDLFAGAGGWDEGLRELGYRTVGIDVDRWACATARAAGHERIEADIAALDPEEFAPVWGLLGSPPCQAYTNSGKKLGRLDKPHVIACAHELAAGHDTRAEHLAACRDPRSLLTVEPLRWAIALRPRWLALEQVPAVLELWSLFAGLLAAHGYKATAGVLSSEQYGLPQVRKRAYLVASLDGAAELPAPTHRSFNPRRPDEVCEDERGLLPWVSMADALGWARDAIVCTNNQTGSGRRPKGIVRPAVRPSVTIDSASGSWTIEPDCEGTDG
jgi:DNA (cytosine-5)-methyltransferase 1